MQILEYATLLVAAGQTATVTTQIASMLTETTALGNTWEQQRLGRQPVRLWGQPFRVQNVLYSEHRRTPMEWLVSNQTTSHTKNKVVVDMTLFYKDEVSGDVLSSRNISATCPDNNPNIHNKLLDDIKRAIDNAKADILNEVATKNSLLILESEADAYANRYNHEYSRNRRSRVHR